MSHDIYESECFDFVDTSLECDYNHILGHCVFVKWKSAASKTVMVNFAISRTIGYSETSI